MSGGGGALPPQVTPGSYAPVYSRFQTEAYVTLASKPSRESTNRSHWGYAPQLHTSIICWVVETWRYWGCPSSHDNQHPVVHVTSLAQCTGTQKEELLVESEAEVFTTDNLISVPGWSYVRMDKLMMQAFFKFTCPVKLVTIEEKPQNKRPWLHNCFIVCSKLIEADLKR